MSDVVPFRRSLPPDVPVLVSRPRVPVLVANRAPDVPTSEPEHDGPGSAGVIVWVVFALLGALCIVLGCFIS